MNHIYLTYIAGQGLRRHGKTWHQIRPQSLQTSLFWSKHCLQAFALLLHTCHMNEIYNIKAQHVLTVTFFNQKQFSVKVTKVKCIAAHTRMHAHIYTCIQLNLTVIISSKQNLSYFLVSKQHLAIRNLHCGVGQLRFCSSMQACVG